jgi:hypothetical protein
VGTICNLAIEFNGLVSIKGQQKCWPFYFLKISENLFERFYKQIKSFISFPFFIFSKSKRPFQLKKYFLQHSLFPFGPVMLTLLYE